MLHRNVTDRGDIIARAGELGVDLAAGAVVIVVRAHHFAPTEDDWRIRVLAAAERAARAAAPGAIAAIDDAAADTAGQALVLAPAEDDAGARRTAEAVARELRATLHGFTFAVGHSRVSPRTRPTSTGRATRPCSPPTSPRPSPAATAARPMPRPCWPSRPPAPTGSCCRR